MKKFLIVFTLFICQLIFAQGKGVIKGQLLDKEMSNEPLSFASVIIKGTTTGAGNGAAVPDWATGWTRF